MKEIGAIFVVSTSEIRTVQLAAIKRRYNKHRLLNEEFQAKCDVMSSTYRVLLPELMRHFNATRERTDMLMINLFQ